MNRKILDFYQQMHHEAVLRLMFEEDVERKIIEKENLYQLEVMLLKLIGLDNLNLILRKDGFREIGVEDI